MGSWESKWLMGRSSSLGPGAGVHQSEASSLGGWSLEKADMVVLALGACAVVTLLPSRSIRLR